MELTQCTCAGDPPEEYKAILAILGHSLYHFVDAVGEHCAVVREVDGLDPVVVLSHLVVPSLEVAAQQSAYEELFLQEAALRDSRQATLEALRLKRSKGETLTAEEVEVLLDFLLELL